MTPFLGVADDLVGAKERAHAGPQRRAIRHILTVDQKGALIHLLLRYHRTEGVVLSGLDRS